MPASAFDASRSVFAHSLVPLDAHTLEMLQPEEHLLIHSAPCRATNETLEETNSDGKLILYVSYNFRLRWSIDADVLAVAGLADYHPGAALSTHSIAFANGLEKPFQFPATASVGVTGRLIYENPERRPIAGDLAQVSFEILQIFNDANFTYDPGDPDTGTSLTPEIGSGTDYETLSGKSVIWYRLLNIVGPGGFVHCTNELHAQSLPVPVEAPTTFAAFRSSVDALPDVAGENELTEVFTTSVPGGTYLLPAYASFGAIKSLLDSELPLPAPIDWNFIIQVDFRNDEDPEGPWLTGGIRYGQPDSGDLTTAAEVIAEYPPGDQIYTAIYALDQAAWLLMPD